MPGEQNYFRKRFFGGFNKNDVIDYIEKMSKELNELEDLYEKAKAEAHDLSDMNAKLRLDANIAKEEAEIVVKALADDNATLRQDLQKLKLETESTEKAHSDELALLHRESEEAKRLLRESINRKNAVFDAVGMNLTEFETVINELNAQIKAKTSNALSELQEAAESIDKLPSTLTHIIERMEQLRAAFNMDNTNLTIIKEE